MGACPVNTAALLLSGFVGSLTVCRLSPAIVESLNWFTTAAVVPPSFLSSGCPLFSGGFLSGLHVSLYPAIKF